MAQPFEVPSVAVYAGDSLEFPTYQVLDSDKVAVDLSSWTWRAQWRRNPMSSTFIELTIDDSDAADGKIYISATPEQTTEMGSSGVWDLQGTKAGEVETWLRGPTVYTQDVTR
jgi:hypothetical protein